MFSYVFSIFFVASLAKTPLVEMLYQLVLVWVLHYIYFQLFPIFFELCGSFVSMLIANGFELVGLM